MTSCEHEYIPSSSHLHMQYKRLTTTRIGHEVCVDQFRLLVIILPSSLRYGRPAGEAADGAARNVTYAGRGTDLTTTDGRSSTDSDGTANDRSF